MWNGDKKIRIELLTYNLSAREWEQDTGNERVINRQAFISICSLFTSPDSDFHTHDFLNIAFLCDSQGESARKKISFNKRFRHRSCRIIVKVSKREEEKQRG